MTLQYLGLLGQSNESWHILHVSLKETLGVGSTQDHRAKSWQSWDEDTDPQLLMAPLNRHPWGSLTHAAAAKLEV